jgi:hypothetical protein
MLIVYLRIGRDMVKSKKVGSPQLAVGRPKKVGSMACFDRRCSDVP